MNDAAILEARKADVGGPYAWYVLGVLVLVYVLNFVDRQIISILAEDIKADLGISDADMGFLYGTAFGVFYALFGIPLGRLADMWFRGRLMTIGLSVWSAMTALSGFAQNFGQLAAARIGVGVGEATASPCAFSMLSDYFPKEKRATALAIYSSGLYIGGGLSLFIGGLVVQQWNAAYPGGGPLGLVGWQAAFMAVGLPGLALACWVATLREPLRGMADGILTPPEPAPWRNFFAELSSVIPPFTLVQAAARGGGELAANLAAAAVATALATAMIALTGDVPQWSAIALGCYAVFSWVRSLRARDPATYALIWGTPTFLLAVVGFGSISFAGYAIGFWAAPYAIRTFGADPAIVGLIVGGTGAAGGFLGVIVGGRVSDRVRQRNPAGRILVASLATLIPAPFVVLMFTTDSLLAFYLYHVPAAVFGSCYVGIAAATSQDLVLPRMRGAATATYFLGTTIIGLGLGPYFAGKMSLLSGDLGLGVISVLVAAPVTLACLWLVYRTLPAAEASRVARARAVGEIVA
jgi:MFS family permease